MVFDRFVGCVLRGPEADLPTHASYWSGFKYECTNNGNIYSNNGSAWVLIQGATKSETLKNKLINFDQNTISGVMRDPFSLNKRIGYYIPAQTAQASLQLALKGIPTVGTYSLQYDSVEGYYSRFNNSTAANIGIISDATTKFVTRRDFNPKLKVRMKNDSVNDNFMIGFSEALPVAQAAYAVDSNISGAIWAMVNGINTYITRVSNGGGTSTYTETAVNKVSTWKTFEIQMDDNNVYFIIDNTLIQTVSTNLPALSKDIYLTVQGQRNAAVSKNLDIVKIYFESDFN